MGRDPKSKYDWIVEYGDKWEECNLTVLGVKRKVKSVEAEQLDVKLFHVDDFGDRVEVNTNELFDLFGY